MNRAALRRHFRKMRRSLSEIEQRRNAMCIARHFLRSQLAWRGRRIAAYIATDGEPMLHPLMACLAFMGKRLALPVVRRDKRMDFFGYRPSDALVPNRYGIPEPAPGAPFVATLSLSLVLTPLVAFDNNGNRLGMGGGFYDRHFAALPHNLRPPVIGVAHALQATKELPSAPWDIPLDAVLTEAGWRVFSKRGQLA